MINNETILERRKDLLHTSLEEQTLMMDTETGQYHSLNKMGDTIWSLLENPNSLGEICQQLTTEYDVDENTCQQETKQFLQELLDRKIIEIKR